MKVYKEGFRDMTVDKDQVDTVLEAGWLRIKPEPKTDEAKVKELADKEAAETAETAKAAETADKEAAETAKAAKPKKIRKAIPKKK